MNSYGFWTNHCDCYIPASNGAHNGCALLERVPDFADDVLIVLDNYDDCMEKLKAVLSRLNQYGLELNALNVSSLRQV